MRDNPEHPVHPVLCSFGRIRDSSKVTFRAEKVIGDFARRRYDEAKDVNVPKVSWKNYGEEHENI
jgi:hypothetical protein